MTFITSELIVQLVTSAICSIGFAVVFRVEARHLIHTGITGLLAFFVYYTVLFFKMQLFVASFACTAFVALYAEVYARVKRAPTIVILSPAVVPIVPGGDLYYTMQHILASRWSLALEYLGRTLSVGLGIAGGIVVISIAFRIVSEQCAGAKKRMMKKK